MILNLKKNNKIIRDDCIFIEILQYEIPKNLTLSFLELEETNLSNPIKYINTQAILAGYPRKYLNENKNSENPLISYGKILKIKEEENIQKVLYSLETSFGSSGAPICIIDESNKLKLIAIHKGHEPKEMDFCNTGILIGPIVNSITKINRINVNNYDENKNVLNIVKVNSDKFNNFIIQFFLKDNFLTFDDYLNIEFYYKQIIEEYNNWDCYRSSAYYNLLINYLILSKNKNILGDLINTFLVALEDFKDINSTKNKILLFNNELLTCFNKILLSDDYMLKATLIFFISKYIQTLTEMNFRYNNKDVRLYYRTIFNEDQLLKIQAQANRISKKIVINQYFMAKIIPETKFGNFYKSYFDIKTKFCIGYAKYMDQLSPKDYDTIIYINQNKGNNRCDVDIFKIGNEIIIAPFTFFKVESVIINQNKTATINLKLL